MVNGQLPKAHLIIETISVIITLIMQPLLTLVTTFLALATLGDATQIEMDLMEEHTFKNVNNYLNTNIYSYLETTGGQSFNLY
jgi:hypothetical protein